MTFLKGKPRPPNSGRKKGVRNKRTIALATATATSGLLPVDYLLLIMRDPNKDERLRFDAARAAAPYMHPRLQMTDNRTMLLTDDPNKTADEHRVELAQMLADLGFSEEIVNAITAGPDA